MATLKQKRALAKVVENGGNVSKAMREAGYSKGTIENPSKLTKSKAWDKLLEKYLPDADLTKLHKKFLQKKETVVVGDGKGYSHYEHTEQPHTDALRALETAYKLKGKHPDEENGNRTLIINLTGETAARYGLINIPSGSKADSQ